MRSLVKAFCAGILEGQAMGIDLDTAEANDTSVQAAISLLRLREPRICEPRWASQFPVSALQASICLPVPQAVTAQFAWQGRIDGESG